ncbi:MAG: anaerobic carbon-monoxide dehydrogenase catalytic subunit [Chloroflexi bacterium]|nr:anaerobic carbon-monoxide dehydrogenase catalytic subunit [Chloroflexota bacterium]
MPDKKKKTIDPAALELLERAKELGIQTAFDRTEITKPCPIGREGNCCRLCFMGPCRFVGKTNEGICGASRETIQARNLARMIAAGTASHSDHARSLAFVLLAAARGEAPDFKIKDEPKLRRVAAILDIPQDGKTVEQIAEQVALRALEDFGRQDGEISYVKRAPKKRQELWRRLGLAPRGIDREVVEAFHRTHMGNDQDPEHILTHALAVSLADGWGGSMFSTDISDILFGTPTPVSVRANLGVLKEDEVNIIVHGHEPHGAQMILEASQDPEVIAYAKSKGAKGINLAGICCTANEVLVRQGIPLAGNFLHQELAILTGAVEAMIVDVQCIMEAIVPLSRRFHTKIITTSPKAKIEGAMHIPINEHEALSIAKLIVKTAIDNYPNRDRSKTFIPDYTNVQVAGFSHEYIAYMQGGSYRESFRPLNDAIMQGRIRGGAGVVGCNNPWVTQDEGFVYIIRELIKNDVLVVTTGCGGHACGKYGMLTPETMAHAGPGLREVCQAIGIPPVLHMGSCVDNSRILTVLTQMATEGGLGEDISDLPAVGIAPEWMSEKALAIGAYFVASGVYTIFGVDSPVGGSQAITKLISQGWEEMVGGKLEFEPDPQKMVEKALAHIDAKRKALKLEEYRPDRYAQSQSYVPGDAFSAEAYKKGLYSAKKAS